MPPRRIIDHIPSFCFDPAAWESFRMVSELIVRSLATFPYRSDSRRPVWATTSAESAGGSFDERVDYLLLRIVRPLAQPRACPGGISLPLQASRAN